MPRSVDRFQFSLGEMFELDEHDGRAEFVIVAREQTGQGNVYWLQSPSGTQTLRDEAFLARYRALEGIMLRHGLLAGWCGPEGAAAREE